MKDRTFTFSLKSTLPVMAGYIVLGIGYGIIMQSNGFGFLWVLASSLFIFAGSMQFVTVNLLSQGASLVTAAIMTLLINLRHIFYGISMLNKYSKKSKAKPYLIFALTDETFSLVCKPVLPCDVNEDKYYFWVSLFDQIWWVTGSITGNILGQVIPFSTEGIDFAMTALFVVIFVEQWENAKKHSPALLGIGLTVLSLIIFGKANFLIPSMILIVAALLIIKKEEQND